MPTLKKTERIPLLNTTTVGVKFGGKVTAKIVGSALANFAGEEKPKLLLEIAGARYDFVLNATSQTIIGDILESRNLERDTESIPNDSTIELETYETGSSGQFAFGIRVVSLTFPK